MIAAVKKSVATQGELANELDVTDRTVRTYLASGMPGADSRGKYNVERCRSWVAANVRVRETVDSSELHERYKLAEVEKMEEQAKKLKLDREIREGELVDRDDVVQAASEAFLMLKARLESLPDELEMTFPEATRAQNTADAKDKIYLLLKELATWAEEPTKEAGE